MFVIFKISHPVRIWALVQYVFTAIYSLFVLDKQKFSVLAKKIVKSQTFCISCTYKASSIVCYHFIILSLRLHIARNSEYILHCN